MSQISKEGYEQIKVIKAALDSMYDKLNKTIYIKVSTPNPGRKPKVNYKQSTSFNLVKEEFEAIAGIVELAGSWQEV